MWCSTLSLYPASKECGLVQNCSVLIPVLVRTGGVQTRTLFKRASRSRPGFIEREELWRAMHSEYTVLQQRIPLPSRQLSLFAGITNREVARAMRGQCFCTLLPSKRTRGGGLCFVAEIPDVVCMVLSLARFVSGRTYSVWRCNLSLQCHDSCWPESNSKEASQAAS